MIKKAYTEPSIRVVDLHLEQHLMITSNDTVINKDKEFGGTFDSNKNDRRWGNELWEEE